jgi:GNAT superfamily N-acetyltransferase
MTGHDPADRLIGLGDVSAPVVEAVRAIYEAGFPAAVRAPFRDLVEVEPTERTQVLLGDDGAVLGLVLVRDLADTGWTFLRYFVVAEALRGQGIGGRLWSALCRDLAARGCTRLLFDVEDPDDPSADAHEAEERRRRVRFYRRLGAEVIAGSPYTPPHHGEAGTSTMPVAPARSRSILAGQTG